MDSLWGRLGGQLERWTLVRAVLPMGTWGLTDFEKREVVLAEGLSEVEETCTLVHELVHVERGPAPPGWEAQEEDRVSRIAARRLLPDLGTVADALIWAGWHIGAAAEELGVDEDTLRWRLRTLQHPGEHDFMQNRFKGDDDDRLEYA